MARKKSETSQEVKINETAVTEEVVQEAPADTVADEQKAEKPVVEDAKEAKVDIDGEVVAEFVHQLGIFSDFIYNVRNEDVTVIVENLGYGDVYVSDKANVRIGDENQRLLFKEQKVFKGVTKLHFTSASQPVVSIIEVKE